MCKRVRGITEVPKIVKLSIVWRDKWQNFRRRNFRRFVRCKQRSS